MKVILKSFFTSSILVGLLLMANSVVMAQEVEPIQERNQSQVRKEQALQKKEQALQKKEQAQIRKEAKLEKKQEREQKRVQTEKGVGEVDGIRNEKAVENRTGRRERVEVDPMKIRERNENQREQRQGIRERRESASSGRRG